MINDQLLRRYLPLVLGLIAFVASMIGTDAPSLDWGGFERIAHYIMLIGFSALIVALARYALAERAVSTVSAGNDPNDAGMRQRIAPIVLAVGTLAITILSVLLIIVFWRLAQANTSIAGKIDSILMGIFASTLPVFATWVGTVLAFYFTNESFKQASQAALLAANPAGLHVAATSRMIPYEKIAKLEVDRAGARSLPMSNLFSLFNDQTTRIIVFDRTHCPIFVIRRKEIPSDWVSDCKLSGEHTVDDFLKYQSNAASAAQYGFIPQDASVDQASRALRDSQSDDLFVTASGQKTEPVLGWLTADRLR